LIKKNYIKVIKPLKRRLASLIKLNEKANVEANVMLQDYNKQKYTRVDDAIINHPNYRTDSEFVTNKYIGFSQQDFKRKIINENSVVYGHVPLQSTIMDIAKGIQDAGVSIKEIQIIQAVTFGKKQFFVRTNTPSGAAYLIDSQASIPMNYLGNV